ncbi:Ig-like domain-containing protein [Silvibacterium acidisoli]|uniref:Ig-like domain-containing protein n=1 Tax=Acidobacteriaceae bacterium ZG23-2 TaxID=2883246 RepID=UPI00406C35B7
MILQFGKHGIGTRAAGKAAGFALAVGLLGMTCTAWAQVGTRTQVSVANDSKGTTFTAKVADVAGQSVTSGSVTFESAKGAVGSAFVENGVATLTVDKLPANNRSVTAVYSGAEGFAASSTAVTTEADATTGQPDFTITANTSSATVNPGDYATVVLTITPENGFNNLITLTCTGEPVNTSTCVFNPTTILPTTTASENSTLQITTQAASGQSQLAPAPFGGSHTAYAIVLPGLLALVGIGAIRRRSGIATLRVVGFIALFAASSIGLSSCAARYGYLHHPPSGNPGTAAGTYTVVVTAYGSNGSTVTTHTLNVALTVK